MNFEVLNIIFLLCFIVKSNSDQNNTIKYDYRKIIHGEKAMSLYPFMISVQIKGQHHCGGSLIAAKWVLTAAHCFFIVPQNWRIPDQYCTATRKILELNDPTAEIRDCKKIYMFENYTPDSSKPDIALIQLDKTYNCTNFAILPSRKEVERSLSSNKKTVCRIMGWGYSSPEATEATNHLMEADVKLLSGKKCKKYYSFINEYSELCILEAGKSACLGDSGGPLMCNDYQYGVISWGKDCSPKNPLVFTRLDFYKNWIHQTMNCSAMNSQNILLILFICYIIILDL